LDEVSRQALAEREDSRSAERPESHSVATSHKPNQEHPEEAGSADALLWAALCQAPNEGTPVTDLITAVGMSERWVYDRLRTLASDGRAYRIRRGYWRAAQPGGDAQ
jgi:hypothetical protein